MMTMTTNPLEDSFSSPDLFTSALQGPPQGIPSPVTPSQLFGLLPSNTTHHDLSDTPVYLRGNISERLNMDNV
jgi:hypothetical protein